MNYITTNRDLCAALGLDPSMTGQISIVLVPDDMPRVRAERYVPGEFQQAIVDRYLLVQQDVFADLFTLAKQFASECGECSGSGVHDVYPNPLPVGVLVSPCGEEPCPDCADIRAVIDRAEGRA